jgi:hypothetical protein
LRRFLQAAGTCRYKDRPARSAKIDLFKKYIREHRSAAAHDFIPGEGAVRRDPRGRRLNDGEAVRVAAGQRA